MLETCQSGLTCLFAKEVCPLNGTEGSNPSVSAKMPKKVLFICKGNMFRSQMAMSIYNKLTDSNDSDSAGTYTGAVDEPEGQLLCNVFLTEDFFDLMELNGMNIRMNKTRRLLPEMLEEHNVVVSMAQEPYIPDFLRNDKKVIWWKVEDPKFVTAEIAKDTYEKIFKFVQGLISVE